VLITLAGGLAVFTLPVAQYPQVTPPTIQIDCNTPGLAPRSRRDMPHPRTQVKRASRTCSTCPRNARYGSYYLTVTFKIGTD